MRPENDFCSRGLPIPDPWQSAPLQLIRSAQDGVPLCSSPATNANATEYVPFAVWYEVQGTGRRYLFDISSDDDASLEVRVKGKAYTFNPGAKSLEVSVEWPGG